jgi:hypothetical protein
MSNKENEPPLPFGKKSQIKKCEVCFETILLLESQPITAKKICTAPCGHVFCFDCIDMHITIKNKRECPVCNKLFSNEFCKNVEELKELELRLLKAAIKLRRMR